MSQEKQTKPVVGLIMGSVSDLETMKAAKDILTSFAVPSEMRVLSAHRTPGEVVAWAKQAREAGLKVIIAGAGLAAHLAGVVAANTLLPVIGVPMEGGPLKGLDALLSTVQMPKGTPVATVAIGKGGAGNAALLALRILALNDSELEKKLQSFQEQTAAETIAADKALQNQ